ncbi:MAG: glycosyltransferase, partial [Acidobacteriota bacterium]|nr:glycosyltransferase [Acidobacteriota bacterium]
IRLRSGLGLSTAANPVFEGQFSPYGTLGLFSKHFVQPQSDWPRNVTVAGFVFYDQLGVSFSSAAESSEDLAAFLGSGPPPIVFTLGSSAVMGSGSFFSESLKAAEQLRMRAVLLVGREQRQEFPRDLPDTAFVTDYAPYSELLPRAAATVHQGGIGTTAQALRAGRPMLVVPWAHDQPDNAERARKLGVARVLDRRRYTSAAAVREISELVSRPNYARAASELRSRLLTENGVLAACDVIETQIEGQRKRP